MKKAIAMGIGLLQSACVVSEDAQNAIGSAFDVESSSYQGAGPGVAPRCFVERFQQSEAQKTSKLDLLFVADTSGSLADERLAVAEGIDAFVQQLPGDVDTRMGVLLAHGDTSQWGGRLYSAQYSVPVIDSSKHSMAKMREYLKKNLTQVVSDYATDGGEVMLWALKRMMQSDRATEAQKQGFLRSDAALAIVIITDEQDICYDYKSGEIPVYDVDKLEAPAKKKLCAGVTPESVHAAVKSIKGEMPILYSGVIYFDPATYVKNGENELAHGIIDLVDHTQGVKIDIASGNYVQGLSQVGRLATVKLNLLTDYTLARTGIDSNSIQVWVDGRESSFVYRANTNEVHLNDPGVAQSIVDLRYCLMPEEGGSGGGGVPGGGVIGI